MDLQEQHGEGIVYADVGEAGLKELCQQGDREACAELDRRGVEPELLELDEPDPISGRYSDSDVPGLCRACGDSIGVHDRETLACPRVRA